MFDRTDNGTAYTLSGPKHAPVVVLVHGLGLNRHVWQQHQQLLSSQYRLLNYDLLGHGDSPPPSENLSLTVFSNQLYEILNYLEIDECAIVGFSLGE